MKKNTKIEKPKAEAAYRTPNDFRRKLKYKKPEIKKPFPPQQTKHSPTQFQRKSFGGRR